MKNKEFIASLEAKIVASYSSGITMEEAERLAGEFLAGQLQLSEIIRVADLDARTRKQGLKAIKAALYLEAATKTEKKPSDTMLENLVTQNELVAGEQTAYDQAEAELANLERIYGVFKEAHVHFRGISRGQ
jgi:membrane-bound lytic murein transglycosylase B